MIFLRRFSLFDGAGGGAADGTGGGAGGGGSASAAAAIAAAGGGSGGAAAAGGAGAGGQGGQAAAAGASGAPKAFFDGLYDSSGKLDKTAFDRLPDSLKSHKDLFGKYETVEGLLGGFANANKMAVSKAMAPLGADATPEQLAERKSHLDTINNVPKDPKGYGLTRPADLPEMFWNQGGADKFASLAQKHSISPDAMKELMGLQLELTRGEIANGQKMEAEFYASQQKTFDAAIAQQGIAADRAMDLATQGAKRLGIDPTKPIFKNAEVRLALMRFSTLVAEDRQASGSGTDGSASGPRSEAMDIINNPQNPLNKAFHDPSDPRNEQAKAKVTELYRQHGAQNRRGVTA